MILKFIDTKIVQNGNKTKQTLKKNIHKQLHPGQTLNLNTNGTMELCPSSHYAEQFILVAKIQL